MDHRPKIKHKGETLCNIGFEDEFLDILPKAQSMKKKYY